MHRKWLHMHHPYRKKCKSFNGHEEDGIQSIAFTRREVLARIKTMTFACGKENYKIDASTRWRKKSIFFNLEY